VINDRPGSIAPDLPASLYPLVPPVCVKTAARAGADSSSSQYLAPTSRMAFALSIQSREPQSECQQELGLRHAPPVVQAAGGGGGGAAGDLIRARRVIRGPLRAGRWRRGVEAAAAEAEGRRRWRRGGGGGFGGGRGRPGSRNESSRFNLQVSAQMTNVLNHVNFGRYSGTLTSPFFNMPNSAGPARHIEFNFRFGF
jgi:hypothetical protein